MIATEGSYFYVAQAGECTDILADYYRVQLAVYDIDWYVYILNVRFDGLLLDASFEGSLKR